MQEGSLTLADDPSISEPGGVRRVSASHLILQTKHLRPKVCVTCRTHPGSLRLDRPWTWHPYLFLLITQRLCLCCFLVLCVSQLAGHVCGVVARDTSCGFPAAAGEGQFLWSKVAETSSNVLSQVWEYGCPQAGSTQSACGIEAAWTPRLRWPPGLLLGAASGVMRRCMSTTSGQADSAQTLRGLVL